jgi:hypothetical protein
MGLCASEQKRINVYLQHGRLMNQKNEEDYNGVHDYSVLHV